MISFVTFNNTGTVRTILPCLSIQYPDTLQDLSETAGQTLNASDMPISNSAFPSLNNGHRVFFADEMDVFVTGSSGLIPAHGKIADGDAATIVVDAPAVLLYSVDAVGVTAHVVDIHHGDAVVRADG